MASAVLYILAVGSQLLYDDHTFGINPNYSTYVLENDSGWLPRYQVNYIVQNIGRSSVDAQLWYGDEVQWFGVVCGATIYPGEIKVLDNGEKPYYVTGLKILNNGGMRAIIHAEGGQLVTPYIPGKNLDPYMLLRKILKFSVKYLAGSIIGEIVSILLDEFWPHNSSIWEEVAENIKPLLQDTEMEIIEGILNGQIRQIGKQISSLKNELNNSEKVVKHYMAIAYSLIGVEERFKFSYSLTNYTIVNFFILPLYTNVVSMKMNFYLLGIRNKDKIGLSSQDSNDIYKYANDSFNNASKYIKSMLKEPVDYAYNTSDAQGIFNSMMSVRSHLAIHGEEFLPIWQYQLNNPFSTKKVGNNVMVYSTFFGKPTPNLYAQATSTDVPPPLCPKLINGTRDRLIKMKLFLSQRSVISGIFLYFQSGAKYRLGKKAMIVEHLQLDGTDILQLTAFGQEKIEGLLFYLSDRRNVTFGLVTSKTFKEFKLPHHRIASLYISNDNKDIMDQVANIAVSYQWNDF